LIVPVTGQLVCVMEEPGETPTFPVTVELVQVTAVPARTAKLPAVPSEGADAAEDALLFLMASSDEVGEAEVAAGEVPHASEEMTMARANRALGSIWVLQALGVGWIPKGAFMATRPGSGTFPRLGRFPNWVR
jgi:hypothetical protein